MGLSAGAITPEASRPIRASCARAASESAFSMTICRSTSVVSRVMMMSPAFTVAPSRTCTRATGAELGEMQGREPGLEDRATREAGQIAEPGISSPERGDGEEEDGREAGGKRSAHVEALRLRGGPGPGGRMRRPRAPFVGVGRQSPQLPIGAHCRSDGGQGDDKPLERVEQGGVDEHGRRTAPPVSGPGSRPARRRPRSRRSARRISRGRQRRRGSRPAWRVRRPRQCGSGSAAPIGRGRRSAEASRKSRRQSPPTTARRAQRRRPRAQQPADLSGLRERHQHQQRGEAGGDGRQDRAEKRERQKHQRRPGRIERGDDGAVGQCPRKASEGSRVARNLGGRRAEPSAAGEDVRPQRVVEPQASAQHDAVARGGDGNEHRAGAGGNQRQQRDRLAGWRREWRSRRRAAHRAAAPAAAGSAKPASANAAHSARRTWSSSFLDVDIATRPTTGLPSCGAAPVATLSPGPKGSANRPLSAASERIADASRGRPSDSRRENLAGVQDAARDRART